MLKQSFKMAISAILSNKMRSFLTMLGIIIGVIAVVVLISLVTGATDDITSEVEDLGSNLISVNVLSNEYDILTVDEVEGIANKYDTIDKISPAITQIATITAGGNSYTTTVEGVTSNYSDIVNINIGYGRFLKSTDVESVASSVVIGPTLAEELFSNENPLKQKVNINGRKFTVVGVLGESKSVLGLTERSVLIPLTTAQRLFKQSGITTFYATAVNSENIDATENDIYSAMMKRFNNDKDAFSTLSQTSVLDLIDSITWTMSLLLGGIAGISLLVGGIGIMNIMLVSVTERTREIGIKKAIGAKRRVILTQFLIEALVVSVMGGLIGLIGSAGILIIISNIAGMDFSASVSTVALAIGFSVFVGVVFGIYPATKASKMHPIDALRNQG